ncbi:hypothetical protein [Clostridium sp. HBUAS56010]|uniref:hypothetical protein n=1 Tax=Clostridium sp. HBUAS56010 TaxID=2571127 RepID=UPI0011781618|nr:hypothetical protein [Clostridium sp. HBUAS56010]
MIKQKIRYENEGTTISFVNVIDYEGATYDIVATYIPVDNKKDRFTIMLELRRKIDTPFEKDQEFKHLIDTQEISSSSVSIENDIRLIVGKLLNTSVIIKHVTVFADGLYEMIELMEKVLD